MAGRALPLTLLASLLALQATAAAQTQFWLETFENGCTTGCAADGFTGANGRWAMTSVGIQGEYANTWFISCAENGNAVGSCGTGCGSDESLHVGNVQGSPGAFFCPLGDCGAAYDETDVTWGFGDVTTNRRIESPLIDCTGRSGISLAFAWIGYGQTPGVDAAELEYSSNGGGAWTTLATYSGGTTCGSACGFNVQGRWTAATVGLPASADGNKNVKIAFRWHNNANGVGCDPSFAVDDVSVRYQTLSCSPPGAIPMDLAGQLRVGKSAPNVLLDWSLMGAPAGTTTHYHVYRGTSPSALFPTSWTLVAGDAPKLTTQSHPDPVLGTATLYYYDVRSANDCEGICPKPLYVRALSTSPSCDSSGQIDFAPFLSGGQPPFAYLWTFGDSTTGTTGSATHFYAYPPNSYNVGLTVTDSTPGGAQVKGSTTVAGVGPGNVSDTPTQNSPKPAGQPVSFMSSPVGGAAPYAFRWNFGDGSPFSGVQNPTHAYAAAGSYTAEITVVDSAGCSTTNLLNVSITP